jgi:hypothetical protein
MTVEQLIEQLQALPNQEARIGRIKWEGVTMIWYECIGHTIGLSGRISLTFTAKEEINDRP